VSISQLLVCATKHSSQQSTFAGQLAEPSLCFAERNGHRIGCGVLRAG
jgi:hypothetical protein